MKRLNVCLGIMAGVAGGAACGGGGARGADSASAVAPAVTVDAGATAPTSQPASDLPEVPAFGRVAGDPDRARELLARALKAIDGRTETDPRQEALAAVRYAPGSARARYALACAYAPFDQEAFELAQLMPLTTAASCDACVDSLRDLATAGDCRWPDAVKALADKVTPGPRRAAAEAVVRALRAGDPALAKGLLKAAKVELNVDCSGCIEVKKHLTGAEVLDALTAQVKKAGPDGTGGIDVDARMDCRDDCCVLDVVPLIAGRDHLNVICFATGSDQVRSIRLLRGPPSRE